MSMHQTLNYFCKSMLCDTYLKENHAITAGIQLAKEKGNTNFPISFMNTTRVELDFFLNAQLMIKLNPH